MILSQKCASPESDRTARRRATTRRATSQAAAHQRQSGAESTSRGSARQANGKAGVRVAVGSGKPRGRSRLARAAPQAGIGRELQFAAPPRILCRRATTSSCAAKLTGEQLRRLDLGRAWRADNVARRSGSAAVSRVTPSRAPRSRSCLIAAPSAPLLSMISGKSYLQVYIQFCSYRGLTSHVEAGLRCRLKISVPS